MIRIKSSSLDKLGIKLSEIIERMKPERAIRILGQEFRNCHADHFVSRGGSRFWSAIASATKLDPPSGSSAIVRVADVPGALLLHKISGGEVRPKVATRLAIPANDLARKRGSPSAWSSLGDGKLEALWGRNGPFALVDAKAYAKARRKARVGSAKRKAAIRKEVREKLKGEKLSRSARSGRIREATHNLSAAIERKRRLDALSGSIMYRLVKKVYNAPDPFALPPEEEIERRLLARWDEMRSGT